MSPVPNAGKAGCHTQCEVTDTGSSQSPKATGTGTRTYGHTGVCETVTQRHKAVVTLIHGCLDIGTLFMAAFFLRAKDGKQSNSLAILYARLRPRHSVTGSYPYPQVYGTQLHTDDTDSTTGTIHRHGILQTQSHSCFWACCLMALRPSLRLLHNRTKSYGPQGHIAERCMTIITPSHTITEKPTRIFIIQRDNHVDSHTDTPHPKDTHTLSSLLQALLLV